MCDGCVGHAEVKKSWLNLEVLVRRRIELVVFDCEVNIGRSANF